MLMECYWRNSRILSLRMLLRNIAILASFVNFLLPPQGIGEGWGGVKNLRLLQGLL